MMKKLLIPALLLLSLASCKKNKEYCWTCTIAMTQSEDGTVFSNSETSTSVCNMTEEDADNYERSGTVTQNLDFGGTTIVQQSTTSCAR